MKLGKKLALLLQGLVLSICLPLLSMASIAPALALESPQWREAESFDALWALLWDEDLLTAGGKIRATGDWVLPAEKVCNLNYGDTDLQLDLGEFTFYIEGTLRMNRPGLSLLGTGEEALLRLRPGGHLKANGTLFTATSPGGYAIWQEAGSVLQFTPHPDSVGNIHTADLPQGEAASFQELVNLLEEGHFEYTGGTIRATQDLIVPAGEEFLLTPYTPDGVGITIDLGEHSLYVNGKLNIARNPSLLPAITFTGAGGAEGLLHVNQGGEAYLSFGIFQAESGYALWQEEGAVLNYEPSTPQLQGEIHYALSPVAVPLGQRSPGTNLPVKLVKDGQAPADVLPTTDLAHRFYQGIWDMEVSLPVKWDLARYQSALSAQERVMLTGSYVDALAFQEPVCLLVFQKGNLATFLDCYGVEAYGVPSAKVKLALENPAYPIRFEWSQDGTTWLPAETQKLSISGDRATATLGFPHTPPSYPYSVSCVVERPDGTVGYSDVIVFEKADAQGGNGGNRGGGTSIVDPPTVPKPDPTPTKKPTITQPPTGGGTLKSPAPSKAPGATKAPTGTKAPTTGAAGAPGATGAPGASGTPSPTPTGEAPGGGEAEPIEAGTLPVSPDSPEADPAQPEVAYPQALSVAVGCGAMAAGIAGVALCLHPPVRKRLGALDSRIKKRLPKTRKPPRH